MLIGFSLGLFLTGALPLMSVSSVCAAEPTQSAATPGTALDLASPVAALPVVWADEVEKKDRDRLPDLPQLVREVFEQRFAALPYEDMDPEQVDQALANANLLRDDRWRSIDFPEIASKLDAGSLIRGEITKASMGKGGLLSKTVLAIRVAFIDGKTGSLRWQGTAESGRHGGLLFHAGQAKELLSELSRGESEQQRMLRSIVKETIRKLLLSLPPPAHLEIARPRILSSQAHILGEPPKEIQVEIQGTPDAVATFDIGSFRRFIPLWQVQPGLYRGGYIPQAGDTVKEAPVVFRLESRLGVATETISENTRVTLP